jgi:hypothetical protein
MRYVFTLTWKGVSKVWEDWSDETIINYDIENQERFYRKKLSKVKLTGEFYWMVLNAGFEDEFRMKVEEYNDEVIPEVKEDEWEGIFYRANCKINKGDKYLEVDPKTDDKYKEVIEGMSREIDLLKKRPLSVKANFKKQPLIQMYLPGSGIVSNVLGGLYWEVEASERVTDEDRLENEFFFKKGYNKIIVTGSEAGVVVSGIYDGVTMEREDGAYTIFQDGLLPTIWKIRRNSDSQIVFTGAGFGDGAEDLFGYPQHSNYTRTFVDVGDFTVQVRAFKATVWCRVLTDVESLIGYTLENLPESDIVSELGYKKVFGLVLNSVALSDVGSDDSGRYGTFDEGAIHNANRYFPQYNDATNGRGYAIGRSEWKEFGIWMYKDSVIHNIEDNGGVDVENVDVYSISSVLGLLLGEIDSSVSHSKEVNWSEFLYSPINPISNVYEGLLCMSPITNITERGYDQPATKALVRLRDVMDMLRDVYNCYWMIDDSGRFRVEHESWFENGGSYGGVVVGKDLTVLLEPNSRKAWVSGS